MRVFWTGTCRLLLFTPFQLEPQVTCISAVRMTLLNRHVMDAAAFIV